VALQVWKRGRWCTVAKIVLLDGQMVLAVAVRHQQGTTSTVSIPLLALDHAEARGCRWFVWRHDRRYEMRRIRLDTLRAEGWLQADGEVYIPLERMERVPWAKWPYAEREIRLAPVVEPGAEPDTLGTASEPAPAQLGLWGQRL